MVVETLSVHSRVNTELLRHRFHGIWRFIYIVFPTIIPHCSLSPQSITLSSLDSSSQKNGPARTNHQNGKRTDSEECSKGRAIQNSTSKRGTHAPKTHASRTRQNACKRVKKSFIIYFAVSKLFQITLQCLER